MWTRSRRLAAVWGLAAAMLAAVLGARGQFTAWPTTNAYRYAHASNMPAVATVTAAMPTGANAFMLASRYATAVERSAAAVLVSTVVSLPVLSLLLVQFGKP